MPPKRKKTKGVEHEISRIDPFSATKIFGIIGFVFGIIAAIILATLTSANLARFGVSFVGFPTAGIVALPFVYAIQFGLTGLILAVLYNIIAGKVGGLKLKL